MDPKDWNKMKKLLENAADQEMVQKILEKTTSLANQTSKYALDITCTNKIFEYNCSVSLNTTDRSKKHYKIHDFSVDKDGAVYFELSFTGANSKNHPISFEIHENCVGWLSLAEGTILTDQVADANVIYSEQYYAGSTSGTKTIKCGLELKRNCFYTIKFFHNAFGEASTVTIKDIVTRLYAIEK